MRLIKAAQEDWPVFDGWAATKGVEPMEMPIDRLLNLVYFYAVHGQEEKDRNKFDVQLNRPPEGVTRTATTSAASPWSKDNEESALSGLAAALGGSS